MNNVGCWTFNNGVAPVFDEHVNAHIPFYPLIHKLVTSYAAWFLEPGTVVYDVGTSRGEVIQKLKESYPNRAVDYVGIDSSIDMYMEATKRFSKDSNVKILFQDIKDENTTIKNACLVTAILTIMFIPQKYRQKILQKIYDGLNPGAAFLMVEKVRGTGTQINELFNDVYSDMKHDAGISEKGIFEKARSIRGVLRPYSIDKNIELLKTTGFREVGTFFQIGNFVGFIAIK